MATDIDLMKFTTVMELLKWALTLAGKNMYNELTRLKVSMVIWELWLARSSIIFDGELISKQQTESNIRKSIKRSAFFTYWHH